jgi:hypothetical protein
MQLGAWFPCYAIKKEADSNENRPFPQLPHLADLLDGTIPILLAASICQTIRSLINAAFLDNSSVLYEIIVLFCYALFVATTLSYYVAVKIPTDFKFFDFWFRFSIENMNFGWYETTNLIVLSCPEFGYSFLAWMMIVVCCFLYLFGSNRFQSRLFKLENSAASDKQKLSKSIQNIQLLETEGFTLSLAYSLTIIIAAVFYGGNSTLLSGKGESDDGESKYL